MTAITRPPGPSAGRPGARGRVRYLAPLVLLYNSQTSGNCYKVRLLFAHLGIEYEIQELDVVDRSNRSELLGALNPALRVPTLVLDDGRSLGESDAILYYFADGTEHRPRTAERRRCCNGCSSSRYSHQPNIAVARYRQISGSRCQTRSARRRARRRARRCRRWRATSTTTRLLVADRLRSPTSRCTAYTHVAPEGGFELEPYPAIGAWLRRVATQPGHVPMTA